MRQHTVLGARLFKRTTSFWDYMSAEVALNHHENWDGSGYPGKIDDLYAEKIYMGPGKQGTEIPLSARVVSIADVYDALVSQRAYKKGWRQEHALRYIRYQAGKKFDPGAGEHLPEDGRAAHRHRGEVQLLRRRARLERVSLGTESGCAAREHARAHDGVRLRAQRRYDPCTARIAGKSSLTRPHSVPCCGQPVTARRAGRRPGLVRSGQDDQPAEPARGAAPVPFPRRPRRAPVLRRQDRDRCRHDLHPRRPRDLGPRRPDHDHRRQLHGRRREVRAGLADVAPPQGPRRPPS